MALHQAPTILHLTSLPALGPDAWTSLSGALRSPLKQLRQSRLSRPRATARTPQSRPIAHVCGSKPATMPDFLRSVPLSALRSGTLYKTSAMPTFPGVRNFSMNSLARNLNVSPPAATSSPWSNPRSGKLVSALGFGGSPRRPSGTNVQKRTFSSTFQPANQNMLAHAERTANNNPTSATAQQAFYSALVRANMPKIVIERYQTGRYASNPATDALYLKALQVTGTVPPPGAPSGSAIGNGLSQDTLLSVGQAVAGHNLAGSVVKPGTRAGTGAKDTPLYVVVEESWGASVFRWVKFIAISAIVVYFGIVILTMMVEFAGSFRTRVGQNNEVQAQQQTVRFSDVHGCDEAKEELQELVEFLTNPDKFNQLGGKLPKGVLLVGPPGTGKTMLARAVAGEAGCPVFYMSGSEFDELYVGVGAKRVRDLFQQARTKAPAIIFIDELDAVGGKRNARDPAYAKQTLNQLLTELDGFSPSTGVILIAATNYPEALDQALTRPGRFDRHVNVPLPDVRGRIQILKHHMKNVPITGDVDATNLARATSGMSGADLENLVNQAAVRASRLKYKKVTGDCFEWAKDKIMMGAEARSRVMREKDKIMTAYHEAGHALVNLFTPGSNQLYKMTIIPRGRALGVTHSLPEMDAVSQGYDQYLAHIAVAMGGRAAEELIYGPDKVSSGISSDVSSATKVAFALVTQFGYSPKLGNVDLASEYNSLSSETKQEIEREVRRIVEEGRQRADKIILEKKRELEALKDALIEFETLDRDDIMKILRGEKLQRIQPEMRQEEEKNDNGGRPIKAQGEEKKKTTSPSKGGVGIKLPEVLLPPSAKGPENARSERGE